MKQNDWILESNAHRWAVKEAEAGNIPGDSKKAVMAQFESIRAELVQQAEGLWRQIKQSRESVPGIVSVEDEGEEEEEEEEEDKEEDKEEDDDTTR